MANPGKDHVDRVEKKLEHERQLAQNRVVAAKELVKVSNGVDGGKERGHSATGGAAKSARSRRLARPSRPWPT